MRIKLTILLILMLSSGVWMMEACNKSDIHTSNNTATPLAFVIPAGFPQTADTYKNNPITQQGFELGKKLFYDGRLSKDGNFACASCHQQFAGFATFDHSLSHGFNNQFTTRNAPGLANLAWYTSFQWDGGVNHLEVQPLAPITAPNEMAETVEHVIIKLKQDSLYPKMFNNAFGTSDINSQLMLKALSQFMGMLISANSRYDKVKRGEAVFSAQEQRGYSFFQQKCAACHKEPLFTDQSFRNTGIPMDPYLKDLGRMRITNKPEDSLKFKVPTLRNIYVTQPYGHDGRFFSIGEVIDHYRFSVVNGPTTDSLVKNKLLINDYDKLDLLTFLRTLTDTAFLKDSRFAQN